MQQAAVSPLVPASAAKRQDPIEAIVLSAFGDDSADETKQRVFAVATVIGTETAWQRVERDWLARTGGKIFHATDCESEFANDSDRSKHRANLELYADLSIMLAESELFGYGVALDLAAHRECFPCVPADVGYYKCFTEAIRRTAEAIAPYGEEIEYTFDRRQESEYNAGALYGTLVNQPEWKASVFMRSKISFDSSKNPRIQMADLVARESMKLLDNEIGPIKRPPRKSVIALAKSEGFYFEILGRQYCASWREHVSEHMSDMQSGGGIFDPSYIEWLKANRLLHDNMSNRFRYFAWLRNKGRLPP